MKKRGKLVFIHFCANAKEIFDDLIEIGVDCLNSFQPSLMEVSNPLHCVKTDSPF